MTLSNLRAFALIAVFAPLSVAVGQTDTHYDSVVSTDVMVPMRDGVKLAADIYRPALHGIPVEGKFPAILMRTPYNKTGRAKEFGEYFVSRGYVYIVQDVRGRYHSQGHWRMLLDDVNDGFDTTQWIGQQPWSAQTIGTVGYSYEGGTQHALGIGNAPYVTAMVPLFALSNTGQYGIRHNGAFELRFFNWIFSMGDPSGVPNLVAAARAASDPSKAAALADLSTHVRDYLAELPLRKGATPLKFAPDYESWLIEAMSHGDNDKYWKDSGTSVVDHVSEYKDVPEYHVTGWYDSWGTPVANMNFVSLRAHKKSLQRLIVGPWVHSSANLSHAGEAEFTPDAAIDVGAFQLRWFDRWLKGIDNGVDREAPVRIYVMGGGDAHKTPEGRIFVGGHWRDEQDWPLAREVHTAYYLHGDGLLSTEKPAAHGPISYRFDPHHPVPTLGGNLSSQGKLATQGVADQRCHAGVGFCTDSDPLSARKDVVVFQTPPLTEDMELTGRLIVKLWGASDSPDTDFTAKLIDVYPPNKDFPSGFNLNVGDSIVRARYRNDLAKAESLKPGQPCEFTIEMYPTSLLVKHGHRIRLDISSSNYPRFDVNPNTGEPLNGNRSWRVAQNSIYVDPEHPSRIILPVIPATALHDEPRDPAHPAHMAVVHIPTHGVRINGLLYVPQGTGPHPLVVLFHGMPGNEQNLDLAQAIRRSGYAVLTLHNRGSWGSPGAYSYPHLLADGAAALAFVRDPKVATEYSIDTHKIVLAGHSTGDLWPR